MLKDEEILKLREENKEIADSFKNYKIEDQENIIEREKENELQRIKDIQEFTQNTTDLEYSLRREYERREKE